MNIYICFIFVIFFNFQFSTGTVFTLFIFAEFDLSSRTIRNLFENFFNSIRSSFQFFNEIFSILAACSWLQLLMKIVLLRVFLQNRKPEFDSIRSIFFKIEQRNIYMYGVFPDRFLEVLESVNSSYGNDGLSKFLSIEILNPGRIVSKNRMESSDFPSQMLFGKSVRSSNYIPN